MAEMLPSLFARRMRRPAPRAGDAWRARVQQRRARRGADLAPLRPSWMRRFAFVFAMLAQLTGLALTVTEGREGLGAGTHIEAVGTKAHYSHDETTCGACHLRSMHGRVATPPRLAADEEYGPADHDACAAQPCAADPLSSNLSRAPPTVI